MTLSLAPIDLQSAPTPFFGPLPLMTVPEVSATFGISAAWVYKRTKRNARDPLPVFRVGSRAVRFDPYKISTYLRSRERHRTNASLEAAFDGIARVNGKEFTLTRKRFQAGNVRLRTDRSPHYWQGFYREDFVTEAGKTIRKKVVVNLGSPDETPNEKVAKQKLAAILNPINDAGHRPKKLMTFRGFIDLKYRPLKLANLKGTTVDGYETNIRFHYLPEFGDQQLSQISMEAVQAFLNQKTAEGKSVQTIKNLKWGLSSIFKLAVKYGYIPVNPAKGADLPPAGIKERVQLPDHGELNALIQALPEPASTAVWLVAVACIRPDELAFKWCDLDAEHLVLWIVRAVNRGKLHTPKYHRSNRPIRLTEADVERLLAFKRMRNAKDDDWMFANRIKAGTKMKPGPIWHEDLLGRVIQPVADSLGLPHITWRLLRHWGATQMVEGRVPVKAVQERLGHTRPDIVLNFYTHVLEPSADAAAAATSQGLGARSASLASAYPASL